jgi:hypothetical protein
LGPNAITKLHVLNYQLSILGAWKAWCPKFWSLPKVPEILVTTVLGFFKHLFALFSFGLDTAMDESTHIKTTEFHHTP